MSAIFLNKIPMVNHEQNSTFQNIFTHRLHAAASNSLYAVVVKEQVEPYFTDKTWQWHCYVIKNLMYMKD